MAQPPVGLKLSQQVTERALPPILTRTRNAGFYRYLLRYPAPRMRMVDDWPGLVGVIVEEWEGRFHNNSSFFHKCNY